MSRSKKIDLILFTLITLTASAYTITLAVDGRYWLALITGIVNIIYIDAVTGKHALSD